MCSRPCTQERENPEHAPVVRAGAEPPRSCLTQRRSAPPRATHGRTRRPCSTSPPPRSRTNIKSRHERPPRCQERQVSGCSCALRRKDDTGAATSECVAAAASWLHQQATTALVMRRSPLTPAAWRPVRGALFAPPDASLVPVQPPKIVHRTTSSAPHAWSCALRAATHVHRSGQLPSGDARGCWRMAVCTVGPRPAVGHDTGGVQQRGPTTGGSIGAWPTRSAADGGCRHDRHSGAEMCVQDAGWRATRRVS